MPLHWYFAANLAVLRHGFAQIAVAVASARRHTRLRPICLLDASEAHAEVAPRLDWLAAQGVRLVRHHSALFDLVRRCHGAAADPFNGHWLRCDIPFIERDAEFVLYTDIDVMFRAAIDFAPLRPIFLAATPEQQREDFSYFNSGVLVMNLPALRATRPRLLDQLARGLREGLAPHDDQSVLNATYGTNWQRLPETWNWKPYWGPSDAAAIVHFHGPKPGPARRLLNHDGVPEWRQHAALVARSPAGYAQFVAEFEAMQAEIDGDSGAL